MKHIDVIIDNFVYYIIGTVGNLELATRGMRWFNKSLYDTDCPNWAD